MVTEEVFQRILLLHKLVVNEYFPRSYKTYVEHLTALSSTHPLYNFLDSNKIEDDLTVLFAEQWGAFGKCELDRFEKCQVKNEALAHLVFSLFSLSISEYISSIAILVSLKMKQQANSLLRNLYELCALLLSALIDEDLLNHYLDYEDSKPEKERWNKYFKSTKLIQIIKHWEIVNEKILPLKISVPFESNYSFLSSYVHNDMLAMINSRFIEDDPDEVKPVNYLGNQVLTPDTTLSRMFSLLLCLNQSMQILVETNNQTVKNVINLKLDEYTKGGFKDFCYFFSCSYYIYSYILMSSNARETK